QRVDDEVDVTNVCTTHITNMDSLFVDETTFNQDISAWDVGNVTTMSAMFRSAENF
ncbi:MAG: BspA family leucine-rich repeat surface protein, partial [Aliifodinibius sp.]|nr:BspA family leucine-rich repeat surface protein [Fodinibius sp.]NIY27973.1 BspA family leucine-rich repeat surface protein [Fodinibius sp.]